MMKQTLVFASIYALSGSAYAVDVGSFLKETHEHHANYEYAEGSLLLYPNDFNGFELRASHVFRPNVAVTGFFNRLSADVLNVDVSSTSIGVGARYFFALEKQGFEKSDVDLSAALVNSRAKGDGLSESATGIVLGSQLRHLLDKPVGTTEMSFEEVYGGAQLGIYSGDTSLAVHAGLLVKINQQFSARAELLIDDGTHLSLGVRMKLGQAQRNPEELTYKQSSVIEPVIIPATAQVDKVQAEVESKTSEYGLSEDELADLKAVAN